MIIGLFFVAVWHVLSDVRNLLEVQMRDKILMREFGMRIYYGIDNQFLLKFLLLE